MKTPMSSDTKLTKDKECESVDSTKYRGMIGSLLYLTASRPDIMFGVCLCARFQEAPKTSHLEAVKRIFQNIKGTTYLGLWYLKGTGIEAVVYADSGHAGDYVDRKSTSGICTFVGCFLTSWFSKKTKRFCFVEFECLLEINDQICPRSILEFYSQYQINYSDEGQMFIEFVIQNQFFSYSLEEFAQILDIPCEGACVFTDKWSLDELAYGVPMDEGQVRHISHEEEIDVLEYQILTHEIVPTLKPLEEIIRENIFCLGSKRLERILAREEVVTPLLLPPPFGQPSSSYLNDDDDGNDEGTSRVSTTSPIRYVNSLTNEVP
ncbi:hypothetical protein Tco_0803705 [Tanacetum coccineum]|uniref:Reverse transcriptase Ty1/copia-type domain-containing protein n=1 Tax=Tanacetum coccineum TaxID=301880 RepID=A0ABQ5A3B2_9ASTR